MEEQTKNNKGKGLVAILISVILLIIIAIGAIYYFKVYTNTEQIYKRLIDSSMKSYQETAQKEEYKTINAKIGANIEVDLEYNDEQTKKIVDLINALDIALNVQMDREDKKMLVKLESNYENDGLINANLYADVDKQKMYMNIEEIFDKYLEIDMDEETSKSLTEIFEITYTNEDKENSEKAINIMKEELKKVIKTEYCSKEKEEITIKDKKVKTSRNIISMTYEQLSEELITILTNLKDNQEYINCYKNPNDIEKTFEQLIENLESEKYSYKDLNVRFSIYTTGITQKVVKMDLEIEDEYEKIKLEINPIDKNNYEILLIDVNKNETIIKANIKSISDSESNCVIELNIPDLGKATLNLDISCTLNEEMEQFDNNNTMKIEELTEEESMKMLEKFTHTKLYEIINEFSGGLLNNTINSIDNNYELTEEDKI